MAKESESPEATIATILADSGSMVSIDEVRGFIHQALSHGDGLNEAIERCFGGPAPTNTTGPEQKRFRAAAEQLWAEEVETFDPDADAAVTGVRDVVLALTKRIADWIRSLDARGMAPEQLPMEPLSRLGDLGGLLSGTLAALNETDESNPEEMERLGETIRGVEPIIVSEIEAAERAIAAGDPPEPWIRSPREPESVFVMTVNLSGIRPRIWRRVRVPGSLTLGGLHEVIQVVMDWDGDHLHEFRVDGRRYADTSYTDDPGYVDEEDVTLDELGLTTSSRIDYTYDFGDNWKHTIKIGRIARADAFSPADRTAIVCLAGERAAPPDDCGGTFGYMRLLELLSQPPESLSPTDRETVELLADEFDPEELDIDALNRVLGGWYA
ncbi:MAG: plasmid pRiA4b ORF-3 family protein [Spirochaetota bacterium]